MKELPDCPLFEHDPSEMRNAMSRSLEYIENEQLPQRCVMSFMGDVLEKYVQRSSSRHIATYHSETRDFPLYHTVVDDTPLCLTHIPVGSAAAAMYMDLLIHEGVEALVACGGCGVLSPLSSGAILVPETALRDEGTSYHYLAPAREVSLNTLALEAVKAALDEHEVPFSLCKTWTTDGFFRETPSLCAQRREEGCLTVEMECAALAAVAESYHVLFAEILYSGDSLHDPACHDHRNWIFDYDARTLAFFMSLSALCHMKLED